MAGQEDVASDWTRGNLDLILGRITSLKRWSDFRRGCSGKWCNRCPWQRSKRDTDVTLRDVVWGWAWQCWINDWTQLQTLGSCVPHGTCSRGLLLCCRRAGGSRISLWYLRISTLACIYLLLPLLNAIILKSNIFQRLNFLSLPGKPLGLQKGHCSWG